ncbi:hypothetical protein [Nocardia neocaledoniensis]|uniref:hypothetical protein n=1 Tax=Nocardia neocaledoniensis TaxID=236511 RepID=UPI002456A786|nr:hypothetical protein [Nocardia neocaledoniensis]
MSLKFEVLEQDTATPAANGVEEPTQADSTAGKATGPANLLHRLGGQPVQLRTLVVAAVIGCLVVAFGVVGWQLQSKSNELNDLYATSALHKQVEQVALDYSAGAAEMDFRDLPAWSARLTKGTTPELSNRLSRAAASMEQIITPLQWTSTARPIAAKIVSESNGVFSVSCFVSVLTKNSQAPDGIQSTATYHLSIDSRNNSAITEIGGIDSALPGTATAQPANPGSNPPAPAPVGQPPR